MQNLSTNLLRLSRTYQQTYCCWTNTSLLQNLWTNLLLLNKYQPIAEPVNKLTAAEQIPACGKTHPHVSLHYWIFLYQPTVRLIHKSYCLNIWSLADCKTHPQVSLLNIWSLADCKTRSQVSLLNIWSSADCKRDQTYCCWWLNFISIYYKHRP